MAGIFDPKIFQNEAGSVGQKLFQVEAPFPGGGLSPGGAGGHGLGLRHPFDSTDYALRPYLKKYRDAERREKRRCREELERKLKEQRANEKRLAAALRAREELIEALARLEASSALAFELRSKSQKINDEIVIYKAKQQEALVAKQQKIEREIIARLNAERELEDDIAVLMLCL